VTGPSAPSSRPRRSCANADWTSRAACTSSSSRTRRSKRCSTNPSRRGGHAAARAPAGAVHAYADTIDRLEELGPTIERIAQKHVALNILPEHYPFVGQALLGALREVLGQAATDDVMDAWAEAYQFLADCVRPTTARSWDSSPGST
jgi:hypothetical protein